jgi:ATP-dependent DNA ligase
VQLPVNPPILPMLAKRVEEIPPGDGWIFEPKWDGFRVLVFRDHKEILIQSREQKSLNRYFPELLPPLLQQLLPRCVVDGELVIVRNGALDFDALQLRIHPAASRVKLLAEQTPASIVLFDLLCQGSQDFRLEPFHQRRERLEDMLADASPPIHLTPATRKRSVATGWFHRFEGAGFDGVMVKPIEGVYESDKRAMYKLKHERDCDCVVAGFRWYKESKNDAIGSLLLGLYDDPGTLQHVGVCSSFTQERRRELLAFLRPYRKNALAHHPWRSWQQNGDGGSDEHRMPGGKSRWSRGKDLSWEPLRPELVIEVAYDHMQGNRFRHMVHFRRWRTEKDPRECTYAQLEVVPPEELQKIFARGR